MSSQLLEYLFIAIVVAMIGFNLVAGKRAREAGKLAQEEVDLRRQTLAVLTRIADAMEKRSGL
jgi:hypothetical protein